MAMELQQLVPGIDDDEDAYAQTVLEISLGLFGVIGQKILDEERAASTETLTHTQAAWKALDRIQREVRVALGERSVPDLKSR